MVRYVLYVKPFDENSLNALKLSAACREPIAEVNTDKLSAGDRPEWLKGVPTLVDRETETAVTGTSCLAKLAELTELTKLRTPPPAPAPTPVVIIVATPPSAPEQKIMEEEEEKNDDELEEIS